MSLGRENCSYIPWHLPRIFNQFHVFFGVEILLNIRCRVLLNDKTLRHNSKKVKFLHRLKQESFDCFLRQHSKLKIKLLKDEAIYK